VRLIRSETYTPTGSEPFTYREFQFTTGVAIRQIVEAFRQHTGGRLDRITPPSSDATISSSSMSDRFSVGAVLTHTCALPFFCRYVLKRPDVREDRAGEVLCRSV
jgi:hypothetical protein